VLTRGNPTLAPTGFNSVDVLRKVANMKSLAVVTLALFGTLVLSPAFGAETSVSKDQFTSEMQQSLVSRDTATSDEVREGQQAELYYGGYDCWGYTTCLSGRVVSCTSSGAACRARAITGRGVICEAWGSDGSYRYATSSCY
jgi:hypothetical protein